MTNSLAYHLMRQPLTWSVAANLVALVVYAVSPYANAFPMALIGIQAFILVQIFLPSCRPVSTTPLCPSNIAQAFFWVQLVLVPILFGNFGLSQGTLPHMPSDLAINWAIGLHVLAYVCFCVTYHYFHQTPVRATAEAGISDNSYRLVVPFMAIGVIGFFLAYGSPGGYLEYISSPVLQKEREQEPTTIAGASATFLRPFLGFALVLAWSAWLGRRAPGIAAASGATALLAVALLFANFSYNRGTVLAPLLGLASAYSLHVRRISMATLTLAGAAVLCAALAFGSYRSTENRITELSAADLQDTVSDGNLVEFVQIYASGPQMMAYLIEELDTDKTFYWGKTLVPSLLHTVPIIGKPFRPNSGVTILNMLIYDDPEIVDQNIAYDAELYINFHIPGIALGYALFGGILAFFQTRFMRSAHAVESYAWFTLALWTVFPGSLPVWSQIAIYFFWPIYIYLLVNSLSDGRKITS